MKKIGACLAWHLSAQGADSSFHFVHVLCCCVELKGYSLQSGSGRETLVTENSGKYIYYTVQNGKIKRNVTAQIVIWIIGSSCVVSNESVIIVMNTKSPQIVWLMPPMFLQFFSRQTLLRINWIFWCIWNCYDFATPANSTCCSICYRLVVI